MKRIVREVAETCRLPIEADKEEVLHFRKGRKKRNAKWLGVIFDGSLDFDIHWKSRLSKARKALGALSGVGESQWGMCPGGWKEAYEGMIRCIATWGGELGWRGQKSWEKEFGRLQYQALRGQQEPSRGLQWKKSTDGGGRRRAHAYGQQSDSTRGTKCGGPLKVGRYNAGGVW